MAESKATVIPFESASKEVQDLVIAATKVRDNAYCPYSEFPVGAAIVTETGTTYTGVNVENASSGMTSCAEQTAICKAVSEGAKFVTKVAVCAKKQEGFTSPCGRCRQVIAEFGSKVEIYLVRPEMDTIFVTSIEELLPYSFSLRLKNKFQSSKY